MVAFELAKRLEAGGEQVAFAGGIDNPPDLASIVGQTEFRALLLDLLPGLTPLTKEAAQDFRVETDHVSLPARFLRPTQGEEV